MLVISKNGTMRNIADTQFNEYKRKGYVLAEKVEEEAKPVEEKKTVVEPTKATTTATTRRK